jgi:uncharacterized protein (UPF0276 family)
MGERVTSLVQIPYLGCGMGYRWPIRREIWAAAEEIDCVEVLSEGFFHSAPKLDELRRIAERFAVIPHGIDLSIGSLMPLDTEHLRGARQVVEAAGASYYSEHLCATRSPGIRLGHLAPLCFSETVLRGTIENVRRVQEYLEVPLVLENVTYEFDVPGATMPQAEFFTRLVEATGCGVLLDLHNVHVNSVNHGLDPVAFLEAMPLESVVQVHLAGGYWAEGRLIDGHCAAVPEETWRLLDVLLERTGVKAVILEHDDAFPEVAELVAQVHRARTVLHAAGRMPDPAMGPQGCAGSASN